MKCNLLVAALIAVAPSLFAAESSTKDELANAAKKLAEAANYSWKSTTEFNNFSGTTDGKSDKEGLVSLSMTFGDNTTEAFLKSDKAAVKTSDHDWQSLSELEAATGTEPGPGQFLVRRLRALAALPHVGNVRQRGLMVGIELVSARESNEPFDWRERTGQRVCHRARELGMLTRPLGDVVVFMPPLVTERDDLEAMVGILELAIMDVTGA